MKSMTLVQIVILLIAALEVHTARAEAPARPQETPSTAIASPAPPAGFDRLSASSFKERAQATEQLEAEVLQMSSRLVSASDNPETDARVREILRFNVAVMRWLEHVMSLPKSTRQDQLQWALQADHLRLVGLAFSTLASERIEAATALAKTEGSIADALLAGLLKDSAVEVYSAAMEAVRSRRPTPEIVAILWNRAIAQVGPPMGPRGIRPMIVQTDSAIALRILIDYQSPIVGDKVLSHLREAAAAMNDSNFATRATPLFDLLQRTANFQYLVFAYKSDAIADCLYALATSEHTIEPDIPSRGTFWWSNRLGAVEMVVKLTGQNEEAYGMFHPKEVPAALVVRNRDDELTAIVKLKHFWADLKKNGGSPETTP